MFGKAIGRGFFLIVAPAVNRLRQLLPAIAMVLCIVHVLFYPMSIAHAGIFYSGNIDPTNPSTWNSDTNAYIGKTADGTLTVDPESDLLSDRGSIGAGSGVTGLVTITGLGSTWSSRVITVGDYGGNGTLNIIGGGTVSSSSNQIGHNSGSTGTVTVTGNGSTLTSSLMKVGYNGNGTLNITNGGITDSYSTYIGFGSGSTGTATVDGDGSKWINRDDLHVGYGGSGTLKILNGSTITVSGTTYINYNAGATGTIDFGTAGGTLTTGSLCTLPGYLTGTGTINTHGLVGDLDLVFDSTASLTQTFVYNNSGQNVTVNLDMASDPSKTGALGAGWKGNGSLTIKNGIEVMSTTGMIGISPGSEGVVTVEGVGSKWTNTGHFFRLGSKGNGILNITDGGTLNNIGQYCIIAHESGTTGIATVNGIGSTWTNQDLKIGSRGEGTLNITGDGLVCVARTLTIDDNGDGDSFINMSTGGMLALLCNADDSLIDFYSIIDGTDAIRWWDGSLGDWALLTTATLGTDYSLEYLTAGDLAGYTLLTVGVVPEPGSLAMLVGIALTALLCRKRLRQGTANGR